MKSAVEGGVSTVFVFKHDLPAGEQVLHILRVISALDRETARCWVRTSDFLRVKQALYH